jgi:hypothetical protein
LGREDWRLKKKSGGTDRDAPEVQQSDVEKCNIGVE